MSIGSIGTTPFVAITNPDPANAAPTVNTGVNADDIGSATTMTLSPRSQFLTTLQSLMQTDPAEANQLVAGLAARMSARAAEGGPQAAASGALATRLQTAVSSGNLSSLFGSGSSSGGTQVGTTPAEAYGAMASTHSSY